ncbi:MAG: flippase-like domain-containing protein [Chloroflexi bacterium]|nr:flippase-like domain-containing protein [Chloroflexota bacterium]
MGNNIYPFRAGEVLRCVLLQRSHKVPIAQSGVSILVERAFDGIVMVTFVLVGLIALNLESDVLRNGAAVTGVWFLAAVLMFFFLALRPSLFRRVAGWVAKRLPDRIGARILQLTDDIINGAVGLSRPRDLFGAVGTSYLTWMIEALAYTAVAVAFNVVPVNYMLMLIVVGAVNLGQIIPSSPGGVGVFRILRFYRVDRVRCAASRRSRVCAARPCHHLAAADAPRVHHPQPAGTVAIDRGTCPRLARSLAGAAESTWLGRRREQLLAVGSPDHSSLVEQRGVVNPQLRADRRRFVFDLENDLRDIIAIEPCLAFHQIPSAVRRDRDHELDRGRQRVGVLDLELYDGVDGGIGECKEPHAESVRAAQRELVCPRVKGLARYALVRSGVVLQAHTARRRNVRPVTL